MGAEEQQPTAVRGLRILDDIVCGVDGSRHADEVVRQAASLAGADGMLTIVAVTAVHRAVEGTQRVAALAPARARRALDRAERIAAEAGVRAVSEIDERSPVGDVLLEHAGAHGLLAIGPPSMSRIAHILVGGAATTAAHALPASLLIARRAPAHDRFGEHIMVASDGLERSDDLVDFAAGFAQEHDSSLTLLHVIHGESSHHPTRIAAQVRRVTGALGERARVRIEPGRASGLIVKTAVAERCSLIIVSSRRVGGIRALGSVSERVVHEAPCSVLVVRPEDLHAKARPVSASSAPPNGVRESADPADA